MITITQTYAGNFIIPPAITNRRRQGIPPGGPADPFLSTLALHLANSNTCLEITSPITLTTTEPTQIALAAPLNSQPIPNHPTTSLALISLLPGEPLTIQSPKTGYRLYLSWPGFISHSLLPQRLAQSVQISAATNPIAQQISLDPTLVTLRTSNLTFVPYQEALQTIPPVGLPEISCLVTPHISRIGTRIIPQSPSIPEDLGGVEEAIFQLSNQTLPRSEPSILGAIQVTPNGQLLVHGPDGPTLGGYPKLGVITQSSHAHLAQLRPGQKVILTPCTIEQALNDRKRQSQIIKEVKSKIDQALQIARNSP
jgi:5-oxoprolinase (ATP-hydrolysing) subunit C